MKHQVREQRRSADSNANATVCRATLRVPCHWKLRPDFITQRIPGIRDRDPGTVHAIDYGKVSSYSLVMSRRKQGSLLPLEVRILETAQELEFRGDLLYGFALAGALSAGDGKALTSHGTLYKALARMTESGLLEATWEDPGIAEKERRPRRRFYRITDGGRTALRAVRAVAPGRVQALRPVQA